MKCITTLLFSILLCCTILVGCTPNNSADVGSKSAQSGKISVVATIFPQYDFIREIAGDNVELTMLLPPGAESHSFEPTPQDIIKIQNCDMFIYVGGDSDEWINDILASMDTTNMKIISLMDLVDTVEEEIVEGMEDDHSHNHSHDDEDHHHDNEEHFDEDHHGDHHHDDEHEYDEHVWTSPQNAKTIVQVLSNVLCEVDGTNADTYKQNAAAYLTKLDELDKAFQQVVDEGNRKVLIFGDRFPFRYFVDTYGLTYFAAFPGCSTETEPSAATVAFLIDKVNDEGIPVVFHIELSNEKMADTICESTGAKKLLLHAGHNITKNDFEQGATYLDIMMRNVETLREALQ